MHLLPLFLVFLVTVSARQFCYKGYKVYRLFLTNKSQKAALHRFTRKYKFDLWSPIRCDGKPVDVMVKPQTQDIFTFWLLTMDICHYVIINNVERIVQRERSIQLRAPRQPKGKIGFIKYHRHNEINAYLDQLHVNHSDIVEVISIGRSYQGRILKVIKITINECHRKPIIFIDAGIHGREWIAPAQALYIIKQLVENRSNRKLLENIEWHILPVVNPDGYEYTHTRERLWRKTRSKGEQCLGADANRNFGFHWGGRGASCRECDEDYRGRCPFSEVESVNVRNYIWKHKNCIKLYLSFHSYGEYILYPWGYTKALPRDHEKLHKLGEMVADAINAVNHSNYKVGSSGNMLYCTAGISIDWVKGVAEIDLSYTIELPRGGTKGFDPPPHQILCLVKETWEGIKVFYRYIEKQFG